MHWYKWCDKFGWCGKDEKQLEVGLRNSWVVNKAYDSTPVDVTSQLEDHGKSQLHMQCGQPYVVEKQLPFTQLIRPSLGFVFYINENTDTYNCREQRKGEAKWKNTS